MNLDPPGLLLTLKDPSFLAEAEKTKLELDPVTREELEKIVAGLFKTNPQVLAKLKDVLIESRINNGYSFNNHLCYGACDPKEPHNN